MTIYAVDVLYLLHTCPGNAEPHPVDIRRRIVHITPGRPCLTPVTITSGAVTTTVPCGTIRRTKDQCGPCRTIITTGTVTTEHRGHHTLAGTGPNTSGAVA